MASKLERDDRGFLNLDGVGFGPEDVLDESRKVRLVTYDGDARERTVGRELGEGVFRAHAAGEPRFDNGFWTPFLREDFGSLFGPDDWASDEDVGDEVVLV